MIAKRVLELNRRTMQRILTTPQVVRSHSTSTMSLSLSLNVPCGEKSTSLSNTGVDVQKTRDFVGSISSSDKILNDLNNNNNRTSSDIKSFGIEVHPVEAAALAKTKHNFKDKILIFISSGETAETEAKESSNSLSLTGKGVGHALNVSKEIATFCNTNTGLIPELYIVSPLKCTTESALLASPQFSPGNIHSMPWICHKKCMDANGHDTSSVDDVQEGLERSFPGIDYSLIRESSSESFLSWLERRDERIIVVSSTKSWIDEFITTNAPTQKNEEQPEARSRLLRSIFIKFS